MKFEEILQQYECNSEANNSIYDYFSQQANNDAFLMKHRRYVEDNNLGFGDRAFHYMWLLLLQHLFERGRSTRLLEIGVYKGQVISLWQMIAQKLNAECEICCITPLSGQKLPGRLSFYWKLLTDSKFRSQVNSGNFYEVDNYYNAITSLFNAFELDFDNVKLYKGLSSDEIILSELRQIEFDLIYIDGDHTRAGVETDIANFAPIVRTGGFLVMDDASCNLPGGENNKYWKGHQSVSDACEGIGAFGLENVLNVGHNRIYRRLK